MSLRPRNLVKGYLVNEDTSDVLIFQFNPEEWYTEHGATYNEIETPGSDYPKLFYGGRKLERISLTLNFFGLSNVSNGKNTMQIEDYFETLTLPKKTQSRFINGSNHFISPPICTFVFGNRVYECVVESVKLLRKMFNPSLRTMQLETTVQFIIVKR